uniref:Peptide transporter family 1 n=1 Tax=Steinernema glaseri TaxID=37863 RepID=A0A1I8AQA8_9BILA
MEYDRSREGDEFKAAFNGNETLTRFDNGACSRVGPENNDPEPKGFKQIFKKWPKATFCIIVNEFCERFSYYGMRAVLTLYLINILRFNNDNATVLYHAFTVVSYSSPLIGSVIADGYIGKFWTIFTVSLVYAAGNIVLAVASTFDKTSPLHPWMDLAGLFIIGLGTGGIKPCVSSFGADQFPAHYVTMISMFFSVFYFTINAGSTISMFITPEFRNAIIVVYLVIFMLGSFWYKKVPPKENIIARVFKAIFKAVYNRITQASIRRAHWMDHYLDGHRCATDPKCLALAVKGKRVGQQCAQQQFAEDCKSLVRVIVMMLPVPMFWALFDQQAIAMDGEIWSGFNLLPDQMGVLNAILILLFIPLFQAFIYPAFEKCGIRTTPLRRMIVGGLLAALSFTVCGLVQLRVNQTLADIPADNDAVVSVINVFGNCNVSVSANGVSKFIPANQSLVDDKVVNFHQLYHFNVETSKSVTFELTYSGNGCFGYDNSPLSFPLNISGGNTYYVATTPQGIFSGISSLDKPTEGEGESSVSLNFLLPCSSLPKNVTWDHGCTTTSSPQLVSYSSRIAACEFSDTPYCDPRNRKYYVWTGEKASHPSLFQRNGYVSTATSYDPEDIKPGLYQLFYVRYLRKEGDRTPSKDEIEVYHIEGVILNVPGQGGVYTLTISQNGTAESTSNVFNLHVVVPKNHVSILWQVPQYVIITAAEILFSITGLEFSYGQAAPSLKSVVSAFWLLTVAFGDLIIIIIDKAVRIEDLAIIMFVFAGAMVVVITVFIFMSIFYYDYVDYSTAKKDDDHNAYNGDMLTANHDDDNDSFAKPW